MHYPCRLRNCAGEEIFAWQRIVSIISMHAQFVLASCEELQSGKLVERESNVCLLVITLGGVGSATTYMPSCKS